MFNRKEYYQQNKEKILKYQKEKRIKRKKYLIDILGGKCVDCGETNIDLLEFDHFKDKKFEILSQINRTLESLIEETKKCVLRCYKCHVKKDTNKELYNKMGHGEGQAGKKGCSCELCRNKKAEYDRNLRNEQRRIV